MKIEKVGIPKHSMLFGTTFDYADSFKNRLDDKNDNINLESFGTAFFSSGPGWIGKLLNLRNRIVTVFGIKTGGKLRDRKEILNDFKGEVGEKIGLFKVFDRSDNEIVLGEDDKHLDFRVSLFLAKAEGDKKDLIIATIINFNNWFGRLYFLFVKPFHKLIVPTMLRGVGKELEN